MDFKKDDVLIVRFLYTIINKIRIVDVTKTSIGFIDDDSSPELYTFCKPIKRMLIEDFNKKYIIVEKVEQED